MPARRKTNPSDSTNDLSFEVAMTELENIVEAMEGEQLPLENLIAHYETGARLLKHCDSVLTGARKRIEFISLSDREAEKTPASKARDPDDDNDITLF